MDIYAGLDDYHYLNLDSGNVVKKTVASKKQYKTDKLCSDDLNAITKFIADYKEQTGICINNNINSKGDNHKMKGHDKIPDKGDEDINGSDDEFSYLPEVFDDNDIFNFEVKPVVKARKSKLPKSNRVIISPKIKDAAKFVGEAINENIYG